MRAGGETESYPTGQRHTMPTIYEDGGAQLLRDVSVSGAMRPSGPSGCFAVAAVAVEENREQPLNLSFLSLLFSSLFSSLSLLVSLSPFLLFLSAA